MPERFTAFQTWGGIWDLLARRLVSLMGISGGSRVLDIGTGGGSTLLAALQRVGPTGRVIGIDKDVTWVDHVNSQISRCGLNNARVLQMDAEQLHFDSHSFDYVIAGFKGWGHCYDFCRMKFTGPDTVMGGVYQVLVPGGTFGCSTWLEQEDTEWMEKFVSSFDQSTKRVYAKENVKGWEEIMEESPFDNPLLLQETVEYEYPSMDAWWQEMLAYGWESQLNDLCENTDMNMQEIMEMAFDTVEEFLAEGVLSFKRRVVYILATK